MAEDSPIEWTDHTHNEWEGCQHAGPGCDHCYAETRNARFNGGVAVNWGPGAPRRLTSEANRRRPHRWNAQHEAFFAEHGRRQRVFCSSLADVFDNAVDPAWRRDLFRTILDTPNLDWLLLTKRIGNAWQMAQNALWDNGFHPSLTRAMPDNVWIGATIINQIEADRDIPKLMAVPARLRFLSIEPLLGPLDLSKWLDPWTCSDCNYHGSEAQSGPCICADCSVEAKYDQTIGSARCPQCGKDDGTADVVGSSCPSCGSVTGWGRDYGFKFDGDRPALIDWVIAGGESGPGARPHHPAWRDQLRDDCASARVPFLWKQHGEFENGCAEFDARRAQTLAIAVDGEIRRAEDLPSDAICNSNAKQWAYVHRVGKKAAGRLIDGVLHNEFPEMDTCDG